MLSNPRQCDLSTAALLGTIRRQDRGLRGEVEQMAKDGRLLLKGGDRKPTEGKGPREPRLQAQRGVPARCPGHLALGPTPDSGSAGSPVWEALHPSTSEHACVEGRLGKARRGGQIQLPRTLKTERCLTVMYRVRRLRQLLVLYPYFQQQNAMNSEVCR